MICTKHSHSSEESARKCYSKTVARKLERRTRGFKPKSEYRLYSPPREIVRGGVVIYIFSENLATGY